MPWLQRSLERALLNGRAHLLLAQVLERMGGRGQALLELRLAVESDPSLIPRIASLATRWTSEAETLAQAIPQNGDAAHTWDALGAAAKDRRMGAYCDARSLELSPTRIGPHMRLALDLVNSLRQDEPPCARRPDPCEGQVAAHAAVIRAQSPRASTADVLTARWLAAKGDLAGADTLLDGACRVAEDYVRCLRARVDILSATDDAARFAEVGKELRAAACRSAATCAEVTTWLGDQHMVRREYGAAVAAYERAMRDGESDALLVKLGDAAARAGLDGKAMRAYERALRQRGQRDPAIEAKIREVRQRLVNDVLRR